MDAAGEALKITECARLFNLPSIVAIVGAPGTLLMTLTAQGNPYGIIGFQNLGKADYAITTVAPDGRSVMAFNTNARVNAFNYVGKDNQLSTTKGLAALTIHELGHVAQQQFGLSATQLLDDNTGNEATDYANSQSNQRTIEERCFPKQ